MSPTLYAQRHPVDLFVSPQAGAILFHFLIFQFRSMRFYFPGHRCNGPHCPAAHGLRARHYLAQISADYAPGTKPWPFCRPTVIMQLRPNQAKKTDAAQQRATESKSGLDFQEKIYAWLLRRGQQRGFTVTFQDVRQTNARLRESNIPTDSSEPHPPGTGPIPGR